MAGLITVLKISAWCSSVQYAQHAAGTAPPRASRSEPKHANNEGCFNFHTYRWRSEVLLGVGEDAHGVIILASAGVKYPPVEFKSIQDRYGRMFSPHAL